MSVVDRWVGWLLALLLGAAVLNVTWQVVTRFLLANPSSFTDELARYLLVWIGMLGAAHAVGQRRHLAIEWLPERLSPAARRRLRIAVDVLVAAFALLVLCFGGARLVWLTAVLGQRSAALGVPLAGVYAVLPLAGLLVVLHLASDAFGRRDREGSAPAEARRG